jgi:peptide/nickel transport system substrate-binding protein
MTVAATDWLEEFSMGTKASARRVLQLGAVAFAVVASSAATGAVVAAADHSTPLRIAVTEEPASLEGWRTYKQESGPGMRNMVETLLDRDPDTNQLVGELATAWEPIDELTWRFTLREGVNFHDGTPFNAEAAAFSINHAYSEENNFEPRLFMDSQITATVVDEFTLDVQTAAPDPILPARLYMAGITSMQQLQEDPDSYATQPIGTGPYVFTEWRRGDRLIMEANPAWWGAGEGGRGEAAFETVEMLFRPEGAVRAAAVESGEVDIAMWLTVEQCDSINAREGTRCAGRASPESIVISLDQVDSPVLGDERIRQAMILALDRETIVSELFGGQATIATQMAGPGAFGWNPDLIAYPYDPERARALVEEAKADGVPVDDVVIRELILQEAWSNSDEFALVFAQALSDIGLNVDPEVMIRERSTVQPLLAEKPPSGTRQDDDGTAWSLVLPFGHGNEIFDYLASMGHLRCVNAWSKVCYEDIDAMVDQAGPLTGAEREAALFEIAAFLHEKLYTIPVVHLDLSYGLSDRIDWTIPLDHKVLAKDVAPAG